MPSVKQVCVISNQLPRSLETAAILLDKLQRADFEPIDHMTPETDLIITIGGDGSFLKVMHDLGYPETPVLAINTGHLGFFSEITPDQIDLLLERVSRNQFFIEEMAPLKVVITTNEETSTLRGINEVVIKSSLVKAIHLKIQINGQLIQRFSGDGIIISTSAGSTAYSYSTGGSIVDPRIDVLQLTPLAPINTNSYRCFTSSVIFPPDACIQITPERDPEGYVLVSADGIDFPQEYFNTIDVSLDHKRIKMLRLKRHDFWNKVVKKFL